MAEAVAEAEEEFHRATKELEVAAGKLATAEPAEKAEFVYQLELAEARLHEAEEAVVDAKKKSQGWCHLVPHWGLC